MIKRIPGGGRAPGRHDLFKPVVAALRAYQRAVDSMLALAVTGRRAEFLAAADSARIASNEYQMAMSDYRKYLIKDICAPR